MRGLFLSFLALVAISNFVFVRSNENDDIENDLNQQRASQQFAKRPPAQYGKHKRFVHPLTDMPDASTEIVTNYFFPEFQQSALDSRLTFPLGENVTVLCHFTNIGMQDYNVSFIMGSLNHPLDFGQHIYNFSLTKIGVNSAPGSEFTFEYQFFIHPHLEPLEYAIALTVFYEDHYEYFSSTFFNQTIPLFELDKEFDFIGLVQVLFGFVLLGGIVYFFIVMSSKDAKTGKTSKSSESTLANDDWSKELSVHQNLRKRTASHQGVKETKKQKK